MKRRRAIPLGAALGCLIAARAGHGAPPAPVAPAAPPHLTAYPLSTEEEASFAPADGKAAPFWNAWARGDRARIELLPATHAQLGGRDDFSGPQDARVSVRATHGSKGLYLLIEISDDEWSPIFKDAGYDWAYDGLDLLFDAHAAEEIRACAPKCRPPALKQWDVTEQTRELQLWTEPGLTRFKLLGAEPGFFPGRELDAREAVERHDGLAIDRFASGPGRRSVELFLPWRQLAIATPRPPRIAFSISYNDADRRRDNPYMINTLRWVDRGNPFSGPGHWGNLVLE